MGFAINNDNSSQKNNINILGSDYETANEEPPIVSTNNDNHPFQPLFIPEILGKIIKHTANKKDDQQLIRNALIFRQVCKPWHDIANDVVERRIWNKVATFVFRNPLIKVELAKIKDTPMENTETSLDHLEVLKRFEVLSDTVNLGLGIASNNIKRILPSDYQKLDADISEALVAIWGRIQQQIQFITEESVPSTAEEIQSWLNDPINSHRMEKITDLDLCDLGLKILPPEIGNFKQLQKLDLSDNQLTTLLITIGNLQQLETLQLSDNQLITLPDTIGNLKQLQVLQLHKNQLTFLPNTIGNLGKLNSITLFNNQFKTLPDTIGNLTLLSSLNFANTQLSTLPDTIVNLRQLRSLNITNTRLIILPNRINDLNQLEKITINRCVA